MYDQLVAALIPMMPAPNENVDVVEGDVDGIKYRTSTPKGTNIIQQKQSSMKADLGCKRVMGHFQSRYGRMEEAI